jgi:hypothetical protein
LFDFKQAFFERIQSDYLQFLKKKDEMVRNMLMKKCEKELTDYMYDRKSQHSPFDW